MRIETFQNSQLTSNTFLLIRDASIGIVDCGSIDFVSDGSFQQARNHFLLLTHDHYDHIYYLNQLAGCMPECRMYASPRTIEGLYHPKMNLSFYHEEPLVYKGPEPMILTGGTHMIFDIPVYVVPTPGHNPGSLTYLVSNALFTGDAYIPFIPVVTKLKGGDRLQAAESLRKIKSMLRPGMIIYPGHGPSYPVEAQVLQDLDEQIKNLSPK